MLRKTVSGTILILLLTTMLMLAFNIQPVKAEPRTWTVDEDPFNYQGEYVLDETKLGDDEKNALPYVQKYAEEQRVSPALLMAIIKQESNFDPNAIGDGGLAIGYMQLHWDAAYDAGYRSARGDSTDYAREDWPTDGLDPDTNIKYGCGYLKIIHDQFGSGPPYYDSLKNAISAYNLGRTHGPDKINEISYVNPILQSYENYKGKYARAWGKSHNVAVIDDYYGPAVGYLYPSDYPDQTFSTLGASQVSAETLASYDTVILFMFNPSSLTVTQKAAINDWVYKGGKLIIWDSDQVPPGSPWDYTWLPYPFTTSVPGQTGQTGKGLNILEENQLASSDPSSPYYIDTAVLNSQTDAVGDANVLISYSPGWRTDMMATNVLGETGPAHIYAGYGSGLVIYSALDWDYAGYNYASGAWLKKLLKQELECSYLPFGAPTVPEEVGLDVQITANAPEGYYADKPVQFEVTVKNPTDLTGINLVARNVGLTVIFAPEEIEIIGPSGGQPTVDIAPGESKTTTFSGKIKKIANNIEVKVNAIGHTDLGPIGGSGSCCLNAHSLQAPDWSFALITDLHIGYNYQAGDLDSDGKNEIDYDGRGWDDIEPLPQESNYWLTDRLASAVDTMINERNYYNVKFVVVLGDISDTAEKSEFFKAREILNRLNDYDLCYIPIIGNHDIWPYTQEQAPDDRGQPHDTIATYAKGDEFFKDVFWGDSNSKNVGLITSLFGDSWKSEHSTPVSLPGCDYSSYMQNYGFSYGLEGAKIDFLGLDIAPRYHQPMLKFWQTLEPDPYPGAATGGLAKIHQQTLDFENDYISNHQQGNTAVVLTHYPLYPIVGGCIFPNNPDKILDPLAKKYGSIYDFGGHVHRNSEEAGLVTEYKADGVGVHVRETEAMARETDVLLRTLSGRFIRIVQVKDGILDCSTRLEPLKKVDITWPFPNFAYSYASYPEPNKQITFTAYFTTFHGFRTSFNWNFDDGSYGSGSSMTHTYSQDGTYNVILTVATKNLLTGEVRIMTITRPVYVHAKHVISSIPTGLSAISLLTGEDLATVPNNEYQLVLITRNVEGQDIPIASLAIHFEEAIGDVDLSTLIADVDIGQAKSVLYMPSWPKDVEQYKLLFIPSTGVGTVYICSSATSLEEVTLENANVMLNFGETKDGMTVTTTFYNGREYYLVSGVTGTGGGELEIIPATVDFNPDTLNLKSKGKWVTIYIELPEGYDVSQIDVSSIMLNNTVPALEKPTEIGDYDGDGIPDLMVKFDRASVIALFAGKTVPENYVMEVTGTVADIRFKGTNIIRIISPP